MATASATTMTVARPEKGRLGPDRANTVEDSSARSVRERAAGLARLEGRELLGGRLGRYRVIDRLGEGGMGHVLEALDETLDRRVALKLLHDRRRGDDELRLVREAQALARLSHPNVVQVYEVGHLDGRLFISMERIRGTTLERWHEHPRAWTEILDAYLQAGRGLAAAHEAGLVHRDFKPSNCIIDRSGRVRVLDFGLARDTGAVEREPTPHPVDDEPEIALRESVTRTGCLLGTVAYMAPEQLHGHPADTRSDQFSFCVSMFEALYRQSPFPRHGIRDPELLAAMQATSRPPRGGTVPSALFRILRRGLRVRPEQRWPSMDALLDELARIPARRRRARWSAAAGLAVLVGCGAWLGTSLELPTASGPTQAQAQCKGPSPNVAGLLARLEQGYAAALERGDDRAAAELARELGYAHGQHLGDARAARAWSITADALSRRASR